MRPRLRLYWLRVIWEQMLLMSLATWMLKPLHLPLLILNKILGVNFEPKVSFRKQIDIVVKNSNFQICITYYIKKYLDWKRLHVLIQSFVISRNVSYMNSVSSIKHLNKKPQLFFCFTKRNSSFRQPICRPPQLDKTFLSSWGGQQTGCQKLLFLFF